MQGPTELSELRRLVKSENGALEICIRRREVWVHFGPNKIRKNETYTIPQLYEPLHNLHGPLAVSTVAEGGQKVCQKVWEARAL